MRTNIIIVLMVSAATSMLGCGSNATDEQIGKMCKNSAVITGHMQGASVEEAVANVEEDFKFKEQKLKDDLARDLQGWDDVTAQKLADLEKAPLQPPVEESEAAEDSEDKKEAKKEDKEEKTIEELKQEREEQKKAILEDAEKKKQEIKDQYTPDFEKHEPRKARAIKEATEMAEKRKAKAEKAVQECIAKAKASELSAETADCRIKATTEKELNDCE
jgi:hypothetical protein